MTNYLKNYGAAATATPQNQPIPGSNQVENSAGGFAWEVDCWTRLNRFLILGSEGGSYYASERNLTKQNADVVRECIAEDGLRTVSIICDVSNDGRAPKNDPAIFALAMCAGLGNDETRKKALDSIPVVCRIGTHLFHFAEYVQNFRGWGRGLRQAIATWYTEKDAKDLAYQLVKYRQRDGWSHDDLLRKSHPEPADVMQDAAFKWVTKPWEKNDLKPIDYNGFENDSPLGIITGFEKAQGAGTAREVAALVTQYRLPREAVPTEFLNKLEVQEALLAHMPMTALIRNLASLTGSGLLTFDSNATKAVIERLGNEDAIKKARVHPIAVLAALKTYQSGHSVRGSGTWDPVAKIVDALDEAFYLAFGNVEATGKRRLIALDVSGSMDGGMVAGVPGLTPRVASSAMAMVSMRTGDPYEIVAFTGSRGYSARYEGELSVLSFSPRQRLDDIMRSTRGMPFGGTDCALPMVYAEKNSKLFDVIEIYTDSETWAGSIHPAEALKSYRRKSGLNTKLVVVGMVSNGFSIADPNDSGMLDVVGFDTATPNLISAFAEGSF